jgi:hypothetical protein
LLPTLEHLFVTLTVLSLLKRLSTPVLSPSTLSWLYTSLFELLMGMQSRAYLVKRLQTRPEALYDAPPHLPFSSSSKYALPADLAYDLRDIPVIGVGVDILQEVLRTLDHRYMDDRFCLAKRELTARLCFGKQRQDGTALITR